MTQAVSLYNSAYEEGYNAALREMREKNRRRKLIKEYKAEETASDKIRKYSYLIKQKIAGGALLAASLGGLAVTGGDFAVVLFTIPVSVLLLVTSRKLFN